MMSSERQIKEAILLTVAEVTMSNPKTVDYPKREALIPSFKDGITLAGILERMIMFAKLQAIT